VSRANFDYLGEPVAIGDHHRVHRGDELPVHPEQLPSMRACLAENLPRIDSIPAFPAIGAAALTALARMALRLGREELRNPYELRMIGALITEPIGVVARELVLRQMRFPDPAVDLAHTWGDALHYAALSSDLIHITASAI
jgi:hypothetical protein